MSGFKRNDGRLIESPSIVEVHGARGAITRSAEGNREKQSRRVRGSGSGDDLRQPAARCPESGNERVDQQLQARLAHGRSARCPRWEP